MPGNKEGIDPETLVSAEEHTWDKYKSRLVLETRDRKIDDRVCRRRDSVRAIANYVNARVLSLC